MPVIPKMGGPQNYSGNVEGVSYSPQAFGAVGESIAEVSAGVQSFATRLLEKRKMAETQLYNQTNSHEFKRKMDGIVEKASKAIQSDGKIYTSLRNPDEYLAKEDAWAQNIEGVNYRDFITEAGRREYLARRKHAPTEDAQIAFDNSYPSLSSSYQIEADRYQQATMSRASKENRRRFDRDAANSIYSSPLMGQQLVADVQNKYEFKKSELKKDLQVGFLSDAEYRLESESAGNLYARTYFDAGILKSSLLEDEDLRLRELDLMTSALKRQLQVDVGEIPYIEMTLEEGLASGRLSKDFYDKYMAEGYAPGHALQFRPDFIKERGSKADQFLLTNVEVGSIVGAKPRNIEELKKEGKISEEFYNQLKENKIQQITIGETQGTLSDKAISFGFSPMDVKDINGFVSNLTPEQTGSFLDKIERERKQLTATNAGDAIDYLNDINAQALSDPDKLNIASVDKAHINIFRVENMTQQKKVRHVMSTFDAINMGHAIKEDAQKNELDWKKADQLAASIQEKAMKTMVAKYPKQKRILEDPEFRKNSLIDTQERITNFRNQLKSERMNAPADYIEKYFPEMERAISGAASLDPNAVRTYAKKMVEIQTYFGIPQHRMQMLTSSLKQDFGRKFLAGTSTQKAQLIAQMQQVYGKSSSRVITEIMADKDAGVGEQILLAAMVPPSQSRIENMKTILDYSDPNVAKAIRDDFAVLNTAKEGLHTELTTSISQNEQLSSFQRAFIANNPRRQPLYNKYRDTIELEAMRLVKNENKKPKEAVELAMKNIVGKSWLVMDYDANSVINATSFADIFTTKKTSDLFIPYYVDNEKVNPNSVLFALQTFSKKESMAAIAQSIPVPEAFKNSLSTTIKASPEEVQKRWVDHLHRKTKWGMNDSLNGFVLNVEDPNNNSFIPVIKDDNTPYTISIKDIMDMDKKGELGKKPSKIESFITKPVAGGIEVLQRATGQIDGKAKKGKGK